MDEMPREPFPCYWVEKDADGQVRAEVRSIQLDQLPAGEVLLAVEYSSLNYKDALAATGHPGVARKLPHVPGIDAAGTVVASASDLFRPGDPVLITGYELGETRFGGWAGYVRMPSDYVVPMPAGLNSAEAMIFGTAGFTAGQSVAAIVERGIKPDRGPVVVTGASGGVGSIALGILSKLGYDTIAVSGKPAAAELLKKLGAKEILAREDVDDPSERPLLSARWAAAVDTVGGNTLGTLLRSTDHRGVVTACGLVAGTEIPITVYPFILRGVNLVGIDSAHCPMDRRLEIWSRLSGPWKLETLAELAHTVTLAEVGEQVQKILAGQVIGRTLVRPTA